jgi:hypothetical protein
VEKVTEEKRGTNNHAARLALVVLIPGVGTRPRIR